MKKQFERPFIKKIRAGVPSKFGMAVQAESLTHIDNVPVTDLVKEYGSPLFVISEKTIRETLLGRKKSFSDQVPQNTVCLVI